MYFIAYNNGRRICDGYAPTEEQCVAAIGSKGMELETQLGDEKKFSSFETGNVVYVRPKK